MYMCSDYKLAQYFGLKGKPSSGAKRKMKIKLKFVTKKVLII